MIKHLLKLVWNRRRTNLLVMIEIFFSFLVLFVVAALGIYYGENYRRPLGFSYQNVWHVSIDVKQRSDDYFTAEQVETTKQLLLAARSFDEVEGVAGATTIPYGMGRSTTIYENGGKRVRCDVNEVSDAFRDVMNLQLVHGRWFGKEDDGANWQTVVVNQKFSREFFGTDNSVGKIIGTPSNPAEALKVVGVITDYRQDGEFSSPENFSFVRKSLDLPAGADVAKIDVRRYRPPRNLLLRLHPGTTRAFEEKLINKLQAVARNWSFEIEPLADKRESSLKLRLAPVIAVGLIAAFLMLMVALGLTGVLWQNVTQRTKEIGLRRAKGATASDVRRQILGELLVITSLGLAIGVVVIIQFPLLNLVGFIDSKVYFASLALSAGLIYLLTLLCGLYPSWLATRVQPAAALHYE
ncbi:MAG TPA: FtsX-like permease family protein [Acidobacteriota bacterium]|jgi:putative ABC transport system permease protein